MPYAIINGVEFSKEEFFELLKSLAEEAMDAAPTRGEYTESGLVYHFAETRNLI